MHLLVTGAAVVALSFTGITSASAATPTPAGRVAFAGSVPKWATAANDAGATAATETVEGEIYLPLRNSAAAASLATNVSTPGSPQYRKTVTPAQWIATFSPTQADINEAVAYLKAQKLTVTAVPASRLYIVFRGTAAQLGAAFATQLHNYNHDGTELVGPTSSVPSVPAATLMPRRPSFKTSTPTRRRSATQD